MRCASFTLGILAFALFAPIAAQAADGRLSSVVQLRAGPGDEYPTVRRLAAGLSVEIHGCLKTWEWCDVSWRGNRGWADARAVDYGHRDQPMPVAQFGAQSGLPEVTFQLNSYWDDHYNADPWYAKRDTFSRTSASYSVPQ